MLGFVEDAINTLFATRRKTMQPRQRQLFLEPEDPLVQFLVFRLQRSDLRQQLFNSGVVGSIHPNA